MKIQDSVALVTEANRGLGLAFVQRGRAVSAVRTAVYGQGKSPLQM
jgi:NAD(P)-dependent dehydrogenase (short-subunit alcohol dehydrogenase family)